MSEQNLADDKVAIDYLREAGYNSEMIKKLKEGDWYIQYDQQFVSGRYIGAPYLAKKYGGGIIAKLYPWYGLVNIIVTKSFIIGISVHNIEIKFETKETADSIEWAKKKADEIAEIYTKLDVKIGDQNGR